MTHEPRLSGTEQAILQMMINLGGELYGKELVEKSGGFLKQRSIYVFLTRMEEKGFAMVKQTLLGVYPASTSR